jgi:hypothetical protein
MCETYTELAETPTEAKLQAVSDLYLGGIILEDRDIVFGTHRRARGRLDHGEIFFRCGGKEDPRIQQVRDFYNDQNISSITIGYNPTDDNIECWRSVIPGTSYYYAGTEFPIEDERIRTYLQSLYGERLAASIDLGNLDV